MPDELELMKQYGLFAAPLNNGDWMVGRADYIYSLDLGTDHYEDERLTIRPTLIEAIDAWVDEHAEN